MLHTRACIYTALKYCLEGQWVNKPHRLEPRASLHNIIFSTAGREKKEIAILIEGSKPIVIDGVGTFGERTIEARIFGRVCSRISALVNRSLIPLRARDVSQNICMRIIMGVNWRADCVWVVIRGAYGMWLRFLRLVRKFALSKDMRVLKILPFGTTLII